MDVGVVLLAVTIMAGVDRERVQQVLAVRQRVDELAGDRDLILGVETPRQCEVATDVKPSVRAFIQIRAVPVGPRVLLRPGRHVARFRVEGFVAVRVLVLAGDVVVRGAGTRPAGA